VFYKGGLVNNQIRWYRESDSSFSVRTGLFICKAMDGSLCLLVNAKYP